MTLITGGASTTAANQLRAYPVVLVIVVVVGAAREEEEDHGQHREGEEGGARVDIHGDQRQPAQAPGYCTLQL